MLSLGSCLGPSVFSEQWKVTKTQSKVPKCTDHLAQAPTGVPQSQTDTLSWVTPCDGPVLGSVGYSSCQPACHTTLAVEPGILRNWLGTQFLGPPHWHIPNEGNTDKKIPWVLSCPASCRKDWKRAVSLQINNQRMREWTKDVFYCQGHPQRQSFSLRVRRSGRQPWGHCYNRAWHIIVITGGERWPEPCRVQCQGQVGVWELSKQEPGRADKSASQG